MYTLVCILKENHKLQMGIYHFVKFYECIQVIMCRKKKQASKYDMNEGVDRAAATGLTDRK